MNREKLKPIKAKPAANRTLCNSNVDDLSAFSLKISKKIKSLDYQIAELGSGPINFLADHSIH